MTKGRFYRHKPRYTLTFPTFTGEAHLKLLGERESTALGLDVTQENLEVLLCNPMTDGGLVQHDAVSKYQPRI